MNEVFSIEGSRKYTDVSIQCNFDVFIVITQTLCLQVMSCVIMKY
jgi:hypothetical protein